MTAVLVIVAGVYVTAALLLLILVGRAPDLADHTGQPDAYPDDPTAVPRQRSHP